MAREQDRRPLVPTWGVVLQASLETDPASGGERVCVEVTSTPAPTPPGLDLGDALDRLEAALAPDEALALHVFGIEHVVGDPAVWPVLLGLPPSVNVVHALGHVFELTDPQAAKLWQLALRMLAEPGAPP